MSYRRHMMMDSDKIEYLEFDDLNESYYFSYYFGDVKIGSGEVYTYDVLQSSDSVHYRYVPFCTFGFNARKSAKALRHNKANDIPRKSSTTEQITIALEVISSTPSGNLPWSPISSNSNLVKIDCRANSVYSNTNQLTATTNDFYNYFTKDNNYYRYTFTCSNLAAMLINISAGEGTHIKVHIIADSSDHRHPIGVTKEQLALVTSVPSSWASGIVDYLDGLKYCNIHELQGSYHNLRFTSSLHYYNPLYGGKTTTLNGDQILRSWQCDTLSSPTAVYLFPRYIGIKKWIFRGAKNILHCDFGWVENMYNNFSYREFINNAGWSLVFRANSVITQSVANLTFKNGTIYVPASQVTAYQATSWVQNSTNLTIAAIGGPEWQAQFSTVEDPSHEYANVKMYSPEWYDLYYEDYEDAKRIYNEAHNISN